MIVPIGAATVARAAPASRVRRRRASGSEATATDDAEASREAISSDAPPSIRVVASATGPRATPSRPTTAFLTSLLALRRGG